MNVDGKRRVFDILVHPEKCTGCLTCQLRCSLRLTKSASTSGAAIIIDRTQSGMLGSKISFTEACDQCTICARYCPYGTLELERKETAGNAA
jgi:NAD-dependent dihydropyrimidine dehydrogenase PreA subunit